MHDHEEIKEWINKAEDDFEGAKDIAHRRKRPLPDLVCFHCQQSSEKYLKLNRHFPPQEKPSTEKSLQPCHRPGMNIPRYCRDRKRSSNRNKLQCSSLET